MLTGMVLAQEDSNPESSDADDLAVDMETMTAIQRETLGQDPKTGLQTCKERIREAYPRRAANADLDRICARLIDLDDDSSVEERERIINTIRERYNNLNEEEKTKLQRLSESNIERLQNMDSETVEKLAKMSRAEVEKYASMDMDDVRKELSAKELVRVRVENAGKLREIEKERIQERLNNYKEIRQKYLEAKQESLENKEDFNLAKERVKEVCQTESEECTQARAEAFEAAKKYLLINTDNMLLGLEELKNQAELSEGLSDDEESRIIANIDERIIYLEGIRSEIESASDREELLVAGKKLGYAWSRMKATISDHRLEIVESYSRRLILHSNALEAKLERVLARMASAGMDTSEIDSLVDSFSSLILSAKDNYQLAKDKFVEFRNSDNPEANQDLLAESKEYFDTAKEDLKDADDVLKEIYSVLKSNNAYSYFEDDSDDVEIEDESELPEEYEAEIDSMDDDSDSMDDDSDDNSADSRIKEEVNEDIMDDDSEVNQ